MDRIFTSLAIAVVACLPASAQVARALPVSEAHETALFLAGMMAADDGTVPRLTQEPAWQQHARFFDAAWNGLEKRQLAKVRTWAATNMPDAFGSTATLFYMFSGPDFLYADTFFPKASTYVLCGIEPIGPLPELAKLTPGTLGGELRALRESLDSVLSFSFFLTKEMKVDFQDHALSGALPILYIFLARSGKTICDVSYVSLDSAGGIALIPATQTPTRSGTSPAPGVRITFAANGSDIPQTLYYFSTDISDSGLKQSGFVNFCKTLAPGNSCVKSASYLMHESYFSTIRSFLLENAGTLVQDDSGIPVSHFTPADWGLRFFGSYPGPIALFKNRAQPRLAEYYRTSQPPPLDFGIGYRHRAGESTLMVATRKPLAAESPPPITSSAKAPERALPVLDGEVE